MAQETAEQAEALPDFQVVLVVEDDPGLQRQLKWAFDHYEVVIASNRAEALAAVAQHRPAVITLDLGLPPDEANASEGLAALREILLQSPSTKIIVVTGNDDRSVAVESIALGAYDFCLKPIDLDVLKLIVDRAVRLAELEAENQKLKQLSDEAQNETIKGTSKKLNEVLRTVDKVADTDASILILGESGTGKELIAAALHKQSSRSQGPFVAINCASIPSELLESELFGHEKGAFTGATRSTPGKIELANGGTLFLDEIGDMPVGLQAKILRFLQERVIERVGGRDTSTVDVRIVCATHQDINRLIKEQLFREDLYFRISEIEIAVPPLRERIGDAEFLANIFLQEFARKNSRKIKGFSKDALIQISNHRWPGNIRELKNVVKRASILADGDYIDVDDLGIVSKRSSENLLSLRESRAKAEKDAVEKALLASDNNVAQAAKMLGITRPTLYALMEKLEFKKGTN